MFLKIQTFLILVINYVYGKQERIIGGSHAQRNDFPYQAVLRRISDNFIICGGAIISQNHILTAAHCVDEHSIPHNNLKISLGGFNQTHEFTTDHLPYQIIIHPGYIASHNSVVGHNHDIAVIRTRQEIHFDRFKNRILLPDKNILNSVMGKLSGWGTVTYPTISYPHRLQSVSVIVMVRTICQINLPMTVYEDQFCALLTRGVGPCVGDGGNPLVRHGRLLGLFSMSYLCASGLPDVYTNVYAHMPFITSAMEA